MSFSGLLHRNMLVGGLALALATGTPSARANVFASNVKINGGMTNISVAQGTSVNIGYILNEPASSGVTIKILSGANAVRTISIAAGTNGTLRGTNTVAWDGKNDSSANVPAGSYDVSVTAASAGYSGWTITTDDNNDGNYSWNPQCIAVDRKTNSPYYGRVFVGNTRPGPGSLPGDQVGIQKLNADGSYADEGGFSDGGVAWGVSGWAPWKIRVTDDDKVYIEDLHDIGDVYRFDPVISNDSMLHVFRADNAGSPNLRGMALVGGGTNTQIWMTDWTDQGGAGILKYAVTDDGTCATNDTGLTVVGVGGSLDHAPFDVALDQGDNIYTVQNLVDPGNLAVRVLRFPAYDPSTNGGVPETNATWAVGAQDTYAGAYGVAVDPTGTYVAVACLGLSCSSCYTGYSDGSTTVFYATNGAVVTNVDLGVAIPSKLTTNSIPPLDPTYHTDSDCAWDAAGNLYYLDVVPGVWRAVSPPGANQATTMALPMVQVTSFAQAPVITSVGVSNGVVTILFTAGLSDTYSDFLLLSSPAANGPYSTAVGQHITPLGPGLFQATVLVSDQLQFYRVVRSGTSPSPIVITNLSVTNGVATISFTGASSEPPSAFTLLSSPTVSGTYSPAGGASPPQVVRPGQFQVTAPISGPVQFYRVVMSGTSPSPIVITNLSVTNGVATIIFTGASSDPPSAFTLLSSPTVNGTYSPAGGASPPQVVVPGLFKVTAPTSGQLQFYRIRK
jgi:multisubunit Na+/H+ antiporter MnhF subunit